jgi:hypothetical protein
VLSRQSAKVEVDRLLREARGNAESSDVGVRAVCLLAYRVWFRDGGKDLQDPEVTELIEAGALLDAEKDWHIQRLCDIVASRPTL